MSRLHPDTLRDLMRRIPFLSRLSVAQLDGLGLMLEAHRYDENQAVYKEGQLGDSMLMVVTGRLSVRVKSSTSTQEVEVAAVYPGEVVGEGALFDPGPRSATVVATKVTQVLELTRGTLRTLVDSAPDIAVAVVGATIQMLARRIRDTNGRIETEMEKRGLATASRAGASPSLPSPPQAQEAGARIDLRQVSCLKGFSNQELQALVKAAPPLRYGQATTLCREGDPGDSCFILAHGLVSIVRQIGGLERTMAVLETGALVGQMALIDRSPRSATVRTNGEAIVLTLHQRAFDQLLGAANPFAVKFQEQIAIAGVKQLRMANGRFAGLVDRPPVNSSTMPAIRDGAPLPPRQPGGLGNRSDIIPGGRSDIIPGGRSDVIRAGRSDVIRAGRSDVIPAGGRRAEGNRQQSEDSHVGEMLTYMQTALGEWNMSLEDLENVKFSKPDVPPIRNR